MLVLESVSVGREGFSGIVVHFNGQATLRIFGDIGAEHGYTMDSDSQVVIRDGLSVDMGCLVEGSPGEFPDLPSLEMPCCYFGAVDEGLGLGIAGLEEIEDI